jgi:ribokinase
LSQTSKTVSPKTFDVIGVGYCTADFLGIVPHYPALDEKIRMREISQQGGGPVATAMVTLARLGAKVSFIGTVGGDDLGRWLLDTLRQEGVCVEKTVVQPETRSQMSFIAVDKETGKRTIFWTRGDVAYLDPSDLDREYVTDCRVLHVDGLEMEAAITAARWANEAGVTVSFDAGSVRPGAEELVEHVDVLAASHQFARDFTGLNDPAEAAKGLLGGRRRWSIVTCGEGGCWCAEAGEAFHVPAFKVDVVDTTGAGDVFHGALAFGAAKGWDLRTSATFASAVAAIKCAKLGGRAGIPGYSSTERFLVERGCKLPG